MPQARRVSKPLRSVEPIPATWRGSALLALGTGLAMAAAAQTKPDEAEAKGKPTPRRAEILQNP